MVASYEFSSRVLRDFSCSVFRRNAAKLVRIISEFSHQGQVFDMQIWNHPGILQLTKEAKDYGKEEDAFENFLVDDSSSNENSDYNVLAGEKMGFANDLLQRKDGDGYFLKDCWNEILHGKIYREIDHIAKMVLLMEILTLSSDVGDKVLVFSQSMPILDLIELNLSRIPRRGKRGKFWKKGKDWCRLDGRTVSSERQKLVERFKEPLNKRVKCTLISTRAGSLRNRVVIIDGSWNPTYDLQAIYRSWRYGQTKSVFAYRLLAHETMEDKIYKSEVTEEGLAARVATEEGLAARVVTEEGLAAKVVDTQEVHKTISKEEMLHLFEFGDDDSPETLGDLSLENEHQDNPILVGHSLKHAAPRLNGSSYYDKLMESLLSKHHLW